MREAVLLPARAVQEAAGIPEAVWLRAEAVVLRVRQEGQEVLHAVQEPEERVREAVLPFPIVHLREVHLTAEAADTEEADTAEEETTAGKILLTAGGWGLWV